ncbi:hypothetical protein I317_05531 [Kwoniella heveanensis CBS 569]|nr:hypothetical protein I317_05531 [Kwoniella heveanensis CBS 569]
MARPPSSATRIIQNLLSKHDHLSTQQIFQMSTENMRPILQPAHVISEDGRIRMKKVSNMREGRRPWIPMPTAPFPDHPFKSVNFLKRTILQSLESQGLIHKARIERPIGTEDERQEAIQKAMKLTRKAERTALRLKEPVPPPRQPKTTVTEYAWKMGPRPELTEAERKEREDEGEFDEDFESERADRERSMRLYAASLENSKMRSNGVAGPSSGVDEVALRWDQAAKLEESFHRAKEIEAEQIAQRQTARREAYKIEREQRKRERAEDDASGRSEAVRAERKRIEALEAIEKYAQQTGEDVSGWYEELGIGQGETIPLSEEKEKRLRKKSGFGLR